MSTMKTMRSSGSQGGWFGKAVLIVLVWIVLAGLGYWWFSGKKDDSKPNDKVAKGSGESVPATSSSSPVGLGSVTIGVAYGTEKRTWLEWAAEQFAQSEDGKRIQVNLIPMGSLEGAHAILAGDKRIHAWLPASSLYTAVFVEEWQINHSGNPIAKQELLALTPLVFVTWKDRYEAFKNRFPEITFESLAQALQVEGGWGGIAKKPDWGLFKFGITDPDKSNSGLMSLVLMAYDFHGKNSSLVLADIVKPEFQAWLGQLERGLTARTDSTGTLMKEMVLKGPSSFDAVMVYESVAIDFLKSAEGRWGTLQVVYPKRNMWSDNPYCILNTEWTTPAHQEAAEKFLRFLMSGPMQRKALDHGFRPGDPTVPVKFAESPFVKYADHGLAIDLTTICDPPPAEVINNLLQTWQRAAGPR